MLFLRQSTASQEVMIGPFVDDTDGKTAETGLTIANTDIKIWVEGATSEFSKTSGGATHIASGRYYAVLDATDTATLGKMEINVHVAGALPVRREFMVLSANVYDSLVSGSDVLDVSVVQLLGTAWLTPGTAGTPDVNVRLISGDSTAADNAEAFFDGTGYAGANNVIPTVTNLTNAPTSGDLTATMKTSVTTAATAATPIAASVTGNVGGNVTGSVGSVVSFGTLVADIAMAVWAAGARTLTSNSDSSGIATLLTRIVGTLASGTHNAQSGDSFARLGAPSGASMSADIAAEAVKTAAIKAKTDNLPVDPADASDIATSFSVVNGTLATLATAANLAIVSGYLDTEVAAIKSVTDKLDTTMVLDGAVYQFTANALELGPAGGGGGSSDWNADERTAIRTILGIPAAGTTPEVPSAGALKVIDDLIDTEIAALTTAVADIPTNAELTAALGTGTWATALPWNAAWDTEVQSECADALNAYDSPTKAEMDAAFTEIKGATWSSSTDTLEAIRDRGDAAWVTGSGGSGGGSSTGNGTGSTAALRGTTDLTPIQFTFPTASLNNAAFTTKTKRIDGGSSANITGAISFLYSINGEHYYQIAYNAADRPSAAGVVTYLISDGTSTVSFDLQVIAIASTGGGGSIVPPSQAANSAGQFFINSGVDFSETFTVTIPSGWDKVLFTVKDGREIDAGGDADSILQLQVSTPTSNTDGVLFLNREAAADRTLGAISVANDRTSVTVTLKAALTSQLRSGKTYNWDIAVIDGSTKPYLTSPGTVNIKDVVTKTLP